MNHKELVAREGWIFIAFSIFILVVLYRFTGYGGAIIGLIMTIFCVFFFRNPHRIISPKNGIVVAPADGRIMDIQTLPEDNYMHTQAVRVRIFLSVFNVHINRNPVAGRVEWVNKVGGIYLPAYRDEVSEKNVRNYMGIATKWGKVLVVQITGIIARRIVCWVKPGDNLETGERFGLIRFGSCTEVYLPEDCIIMVESGQKVKGGETVIARFYE